MPRLWKALAILALLILCVAPARAQYLTQSIALKPGWNAVYLRVNATNDSLENIVGALSPISEIWLWRPNQIEGRIFTDPVVPISGSDWVQWTKASGPAGAFQLLANYAYLIRNASATEYTWNLKGKPVPPEFRWSSSGLNFIGFSTRESNPPVFSNFLAPALSATPFEIFNYPGGEGPTDSPATAPVFSQNTVTARRNEAFWIRKQDNTDNRYFGPLEIVLQDYRGVNFHESGGAYSLRIRNQTAQTNSITATLIASETSPSGDVIQLPPLLLRTGLNTTNLTYGYTNLPANQPRGFILAPKGRPGSEIEVVIGLDRASMIGTNGTLFAGILRLQDVTLSHIQIDLPVSATQSSTEGLWVGNAAITQVGNYLKTYAKATNAVDFTNKMAQLQVLNEANKTVVFTNDLWEAHPFAPLNQDSIAANHFWKTVAISADGLRMLAGEDGRSLYTSADGGLVWKMQLSSPALNWRAAATSADGTNLVAVVDGGQIYTSPNGGQTWTARETERAWSAVASSASGAKLVASESGGRIYTSDDTGATWVSRTVPDLDWASLSSSTDGTNLVAVANGGQIYVSLDAGATWDARESSRPWTSVASSWAGDRLVAVASGGGIYTSGNWGTNWTVQPGAPTANWAAVASATNGLNLVAAVNGGRLYTSTDGGAAWTARDTNRAWIAVASSADGSTLAAMANNGLVHISPDFGVNWHSVSEQQWVGIASSDDGVKLVAAARNNALYTSVDSGATWITSAGAPATNWQAVASSADGLKLAAVAGGGRVYTSIDGGSAWTPRLSAPSGAWRSVASSADGLTLAAAMRGGAIHTSTDGGSTWSARAGVQNWQAITMSPDGKILVAAIDGGQIYSSSNGGTNWTTLFGAPAAAWRAVATSGDGKSLVAAASGSGIYLSIDAGVTWDLKSPPANANWRALASSTNGNIIIAAVDGGRIYTSTNAGAAWTARESIRPWSTVAMTPDGTQLLAAEDRGAGRIYRLGGALVTPTLVYDPNTQFILRDGVKYLGATFDSELGSVPNPFPLRLVVHSGSNGVTRLLQHVFVGPDAVTTNTIITLEESKLHPKLLANARRITAVHLPISNVGWPLAGEFGGVGIMNASVIEGFNNEASNPFMHSYHPDHDNLDALFQPISKPGQESYDIRRQITLSFTPPSDDFAGRTATSSTVQGTYLENIVLKGGDNQTRTVVTKGNFVLNRVSAIATLK
jgi:photosystem II stability/assembly factor-like uncharacterized protein